jgi:hypothetical protein
MKNKIVLYCKTYRNDIDRVAKLVESINKYNIDNIPFYISIPNSDLEIFKQRNFHNVHLITDEFINSNENLYNRDILPRLLAFSTRLNIWMTELADNYMCLDADAFFIRPFSIADFMYDDNTPYTVMHEQKELFSWTSCNQTQFRHNPKNSFKRNRSVIMDIFGRTGKQYDFGPNPIVMNSQVLQDFNTEYLTPNNLTTEDIIQVSSDEYTWYGESLLAFNSIKLMPCEPLFKVFHYGQQYIEYKQRNVTLEMISENYMGIIMQSNFNGPIEY